MKKTLDPATAYASEVVAGNVIACKLHIQACQRHLNDLQNAKAKGLYFDAEQAQIAIDFFAILKHWQGAWAGQPFLLEPWQAFIVGCIFGWKVKQTGLRRFRLVYIEIPRKNGKSTLAGGVGLYCLLLDAEPGGQVYTGATKMEQARIIHRDSIRMIRACPSINKRVRILKDNVSVESTGSKYEPLGADAKRLDGLHPSCALLDELHAHPTRELYDVIADGMGARAQPLLFEITTAGYNQQGICFQHHKHAKGVLCGNLQDDSFFTFITSIDDEDDWTDETAWHKANPNLTKSKYIKYMHDKCKEAQDMPAAQNAFKNKQLNIWTQQAVKWLPTEKWTECAAVLNASDLHGKTCFTGIDLSSTTDLTAVVHAFPDVPFEGMVSLIPAFFCPYEKIQQRSRTDRVPYDLWSKEGWLIATEGNAVDDECVRRHINEDGKKFDIQSIACDPWNALSLMIRLTGDGFEVKQFRQGFQTMSPASKSFEKLILKKAIAHGDHPIMNWMIGNVCVRTDPTENIKPDKEKSQDRIDGVVAAIMAIGLCSIAQPQDCPYDENNGLFFI